MKLQDLIVARDMVKAEESKAVQKAEKDIEEYLRNETVTVQELYDIVAGQWNKFASSSGQVSTWQILDIAKRAILNRKGEVNGKD